MVQKYYSVKGVSKRKSVKELFGESVLRLGGEEVQDNMMSNDIYHCSELRTTVVYYPEDFEATIVGEDERFLNKTASDLEKIGKVKLEVL